MSVWYAIPSCRPVHEAQLCLDRWRWMGYKTAVLRQGSPIQADLHLSTQDYLGWPTSTNALARLILFMDPDAMWIVGGGDDYLPDPNIRADEIAAQCEEYFRLTDPCTLTYLKMTIRDSETFGVMQPTGDRWGDSESSRKTFGENRGAEIDRICGSPWMGRTWCERAYRGKGPMCEAYFHLYADEELHDVAERMGVLWQRRTLLQYHDHPSRKYGYGVYQRGHLAPLYSAAAWEREKAMFLDRKSKGFPDSFPFPNFPVGATP